MNGRTIWRQRDEIVDEGRDKLERDVYVAMIDVDCGKTIWKVCDFSQRCATFVLQNEFQVTESLDERNYLTFFWLIFISIRCQDFSGWIKNMYSNNNNNEK
jgi:hypothetical protein